MQHQLKNTDDGYLNRLFGTFAEFDVVSSGMLKANTIPEFMYSFEQSMKVDKRLTVLFLRKFGAKGLISSDFIYLAQNALGQSDNSIEKEKNFYQNNGKVINIRWKK